MKIKEEEIIRLMSGEKTREKGVRLMMDAYQSRLYWHIRRIIVDHALSQDVLQETFIKAYQNLNSFRIAQPTICEPRLCDTLTDSSKQCDST